MNKELRYELRAGKFGQYFHDLDEGKDLPLIDVLKIMNNQCGSHAKEWLSIENKRLKEEIADHIANTQSALAERNALAGDLERERDGMLKLRKEFGAFEDETVWQFVKRLATLSDQGELRLLRLKVKEDAKQIVDLLHEREANRKAILETLEALTNKLH